MSPAKYTFSFLALALVFSSQACSTVYIETLEGRPCEDDGSCVNGLLCNPVNNLCGVPVEWSYNLPSSYPDALQTGDLCPGPGAYIPCSNEALGCEDGCRTCSENNGWSACSDFICELGLLHTCSSCADDCRESVQNSRPVCLAAGDSFACAFEGECNPETVDLDQNPVNGCECIISAELCDTEDNDCDGQVDNEADDCTLFYADKDGDDQGVESDYRCLCAAEGIYSVESNLGDCDDNDSSTYSGASELCDGNQNDCDGAILHSEVDWDGDGYVECIGWIDVQSDDPNISGGADCEPQNYLVSPPDSCTVSDGWDCTNAVTGCTSVCGDGLLRAEEECDDGGVVNFDGCNSACQVETGWYCTQAGDECLPLCNDGDLTGAVNAHLEFPYAKTFISESVPAQSSTLYVSSASDFQVGDEIFVITMRGAGTDCDSSAAGLWDLAYVLDKGSDWLKIDPPLSRELDISAGQMHQVIEVRGFNQINMLAGSQFYAPGWNGQTGGVLILRAESVTFEEDSWLWTKTGYRGGVSGTAHAEGPLGFLATGGGTGGTGGYLANGSDGGPGQSGVGGGGGGGSAGGNSISASGGSCGGGGGGGAGRSTSSGGGQGAGGGGLGYAGATTIASSGAGGGGCPYDRPPRCTAQDGSRLMMGSGAAAGAAGGCAYRAGGEADGSTSCVSGPSYIGSNNSGSNGDAGGGVVILLANQIHSNVVTEGGLWLEGRSGGVGGNGNWEYVNPHSNLEGLGGGGGGGGAQGADGGTAVVISESVTGNFLIWRNGGAGGAGGAGGNGTCGNYSYSLVSGGASNSGVGSDGASPSYNVYCGGGGGGGLNGLPGEVGPVYTSGADWYGESHVQDAVGIRAFGLSCRSSGR